MAPLIRVRDASGKLQDIAVEPQDTVADLKRRIQETLDIQDGSVVPHFQGMPNVSDSSRVADLFPKGATLNIDIELPEKTLKPASGSEKPAAVVSQGEAFVHLNTATGEAKMRNVIFGASQGTKAEVKENKASDKAYQDNFVITSVDVGMAFFKSSTPSSQE